MKRLFALLAAAAAGFVLGAMWSHGVPRERATRAAPAMPAPEPPAAPASAESAPQPTPLAAAPPASPGERSGRLPLHVEVLDPDGLQVARATVTLKRGDDQRRLAWAADAPVLLATPGAYQVHAETADGLRSLPQLVWLRPADPAARVTLVVDSSPGIRGHVTLPAGFDADIGVYALRFEGEEPSDIILRTKGKGRTASAKTDYGFAFGGLDPGVYAVGARYRLGCFTLNARTTVTVDSGIAEVELVIADLPAAEGTTVRVLDPAGSPCDDAELSGGFTAGGRIDIGYAPVGRRADGFWILQPGTELSRREGYRECVKIRSPRFGETYAEVTPGCEVRLSEPAWLEIRAVPHDGIRLRTALDLLALDGWRRIQDSDGLTRGGRQGAGPLQAGTYRIITMVGTAGRDACLWPVEVRELIVHAGVHEVVTVNVPPPEHTLRVQASGGRVAWRVELTRRLETFGGRDSRSAAAGEVVEFRGLPAGTYLLEAPDAGTRREVDVPANEIVQFP